MKAVLKFPIWISGSTMLNFKILSNFPHFELVESLGLDFKILPFSENITKCAVIGPIPRQFNGYDEAIIEFPKFRSAESFIYQKIPGGLSGCDESYTKFPNLVH